MAIVGQALVSKALVAGPTSPLFAKGLMLNPASYSPLPNSGMDSIVKVFGQITRKISQCSLSGHVFYEGSSSHPHNPDFRRATYGMALLDSNNRVWNTMHGNVPAYMPQTSQAGEHSGRTKAVLQFGGTPLPAAGQPAVSDAEKLVLV